MGGARRNVVTGGNRWLLVATGGNFCAKNVLTTFGGTKRQTRKGNRGQRSEVRGQRKHAKENKEQIHQLPECRVQSAELNRTAEREAKNRSNTKPGGTSAPASRKSINSQPSTINRARRVRFVCHDIVLPRYKTVIFVHGCFWHRHRGCKNCTTPTNRQLARFRGLLKTLRAREL